MNYNILHITDLHVSKPDEGVLRTGFFDEYISMLREAITEQKIDKIDYLFLTGDFADKDSALGYEHSKDIIQFLIDHFEIEAERLIISIGNHDYTRTLEIDKKKHQEARKRIIEIKDYYVKASKIEFFDHYELYDLENFYCLNLDSTFGTLDSSCPGKLEKDQIDAIVKSIKNLKDHKPLHILTHYPFIEYPGRPDSFEEEDWFKKHFWSSGIPVFKRIQTIYKDLPVVIYNGDIHHSDHFQFANIHTLSCGSFGYASANQPRQAKVIQFENHSINEIVTFNWQPHAHEDTGHYGNWEPARRKARIYDFDKKLIGTSKVPTPIDDNVDLLNPETNKKIYKAFKKTKIFHFGRYSSVGKEKVSLGWMDINALMNESKLLPIICEDLANYINKELNESGFSTNEAVIFGMDCWGTALSGLVSANTNVESLCFPARGLSRYYSLDELVTDRMINTIQKKKLIFYVCDVVATGNTCRNFINLLSDKVKLNDKNIIVYSTLKAKRLSYNLEFAKVHMASASIKIPLLDFEDLPDEGVWPTDIYFRID